MKHGKSIKTLPSDELYDVALYLMFEFSIMYEEQHKAMESLRKGISDKIFERETGMPAISRWFGAADGSTAAGM